MALAAKSFLVQQIHFLIRRLQSTYRNKLFAIRQEQLAVAKERALEAKCEWLLYVQKWNSWRIQCDLMMCDGCSYRKGECRCRHRARPDDLAEMLRHLAGLNPRHGKTGFIHDEDRSDGPVGYRVCGRDGWDNAVRAWEEDR